MAKFVEWIEPLDNEHPELVVICRVSEQDAIQHMKNRPHVYISDEEALYDFLVIHWGIIKEYKEYNE